MEDAAGSTNNEMYYPKAVYSQLPKAISKEFHKVETHLNEALKALTPYYNTNHL